ncbi:hypothetical protein KY334_04765 [Candidatus Woesearchaeota archaeon]|nr:hypothetical protein [Candidatus Woesearchaeota archaeon]
MLDVTLYAKCECCGCEKEVFSANIRLSNLSNELGIHDLLCYPYDKKLNITKAYQLITPLKNALVELSYNKEKYAKFNTFHNGRYYNDDFISFLEEYLGACIQYPLARISTC